MAETAWQAAQRRLLKRRLARAADRGRDALARELCAIWCELRRQRDRQPLPSSLGTDWPDVDCD